VLVLVLDYNMSFHLVLALVFFFPFTPSEPENSPCVGETQI
jgi:hypothetical protein